MAFIKVSGTAFPIYGTVAGANAYLAGASHGTAWAAADFATKNSALITAARILDRQRWLGSPTDPVDASDPESQPAGTQPLQWPRAGLVDRNGDPLASDAIPQDVIDAAYEIALDLASPSSTVQTQNASQRIKSQSTTEKVDVISVSSDVSYFANTSRETRRFSRIVTELIGLWLSSSAAIAFTIVSGADESQFTDQDTNFGFGGLPGLP